MTEELRLLQVRYFMLHGWARFLDRRSHEDTMRRIAQRRPEGNWGIAVSEDYWALQWQRYNFKARRAARAIGHDKIRVFNFSGEGPLSLKLAGSVIPGWETDPEEKAKAKDFERMQELRLKVSRACQLLKQMPEAYDVKEELSRLDWEDTCRDAMGF